MGRHPRPWPIDDKLHRDIHRLIAGAREFAPLDVSFGKRMGKKRDPLTFFCHFQIGRGENRAHRRHEAWASMLRPVRLKDGIKARCGRVGDERRVRRTFAQGPEGGCPNLVRKAEPGGRCRLGGTETACLANPQHWPGPCD